MPRLMVEKGAEKGRSFLIKGEGLVVVGRGPTANIRLNDQMVSREHCRLRVQGDRIVVEDAGSTNGTYVGGQRIEAPTDLGEGESFTVGETQISLLSDAEQQGEGGLVGRTLGGYRLLQRVGKGGAGTVYRAEQLSLRRTVALKVLSESLTKDPEFVKMFLREARAAAQLNHPHIVQVHDVGHDGGTYYFSMEFMEGGSLVDILTREGVLPAERLVPVLVDAARGLNFIERQGIVHRDVKPDNLMFTAENSCKLGDLGIARARTEGAKSPGGVFGSPHYISPEQVLGKPVDSRSDIYSLGLTAYRSLCGHTPFQGKSVRELFLKQVKEMPPPLRQIAPGAPRDLVEIVERMIQKDPAARYASVADVLAAFDTLGEGRKSYRGLRARNRASASARGGMKRGPMKPPVTFPGVGGAAPAARAGPVGPGPAGPGPVRPGLVKPGAARPGPGRPGIVRPGQVRPTAAPPGIARPGAVRHGPPSAPGGAGPTRPAAPGSRPALRPLRPKGKLRP